MTKDRKFDDFTTDANATPRKFLLVWLQKIRTPRNWRRSALRLAGKEDAIRFEFHQEIHGPQKVTRSFDAGKVRREDAFLFGETYWYPLICIYRRLRI
jgi:hypothetical protein